MRRIQLPQGCKVWTVSEDGASIYSASEIARREFPDEDVTVRGAVSIGRRLMDPLADKMLVCTALICFVQLRENFPCWCAVVVVAREFIISGFRQLAAEKKTIIMASIWGKAKTFVSLIMCILFIIDWEYGWFTVTETVFMYASTLLTVVSLVDYLIKNWQVMRDCTK